MVLLSEKDEKSLVRKATLNLKRKYGRVKQINIVERDAYIPTNVEQEIRETFLKKKVISASDIALKYDIRISAIKMLLRQYEEEGLIKLLDPSLKVKVYIPIS